MLKLFKIQKPTLIICSLLIIIGVAFGIFTNKNFCRLSKNESSFDNAVLSFEDGIDFYIDEMANKTNFEEALYLLDEPDYIFKVECTSTEYCFNCTKYNAKVTDTLKGDIDETGNNIVLYQWVCFSKYDDDTLIFDSPDFSLPLKNNKEYLVFANKREYCEDYQNSLSSNEYSIPLRGPVPYSYVLNDTQNDYVDIKNDKTFSSLNDIYYLCFSKDSLDNVNNLSKSVIEYYK